MNPRARAVDIVRGLAATAVLGTLVVGIPVLLVRGIGWPLWRSVPDLSNAVDLLDDGLPERAFLNLVACLAWFVWAQFVSSIVVEVVATVRGRATGEVVGVPRSMQTAAARLVATALLLITALASRPGGSDTHALPPVEDVRPPTTLVDDDPSDPPAAHAARANSESAPAVAAREWVVQRRDTLWGIAETTLGAGDRYDEILQLNRNRPQPAGGSLRGAADRLQPGWRLVLPADAVIPGDADVVTDGVYVVQPGDSLSKIAHQTLGDRDKWPVLFEANRGRPQPDGTMLQDPDVLSVGWQLHVPASSPDSVVVAEGDTLSGIARTFLGDAERWPEIFDQNVGVPQPDGRALHGPDQIDIGWTLDLPGRPAPVAEPAPPSPAPDPPTVDDFTPTNLRGDAPFVAEPVPGDEMPSDRETQPGRPPTQSADDGDLAHDRLDDDDDGPIGRVAAHTAPGGPDDGARDSAPAPAVGGAVAAGLLGLLASIRAHRRRRRRPDTVVPGTSDASRRLEAGLRSIADLDERTLVDLALRSLTGSLEDVPSNLAFRSVVVADGRLAVSFDRPLRTTPPGWTAEGSTLHLDPSVDQDVLEALASGPDGRWRPVPAPTLLPIGETLTDPSASVYVDLERAGVLALDGEPTDVDAALRGLLYGAMASSWAEEVDLVVVGALDLPVEVPWASAIETLDDAVGALEERSAHVRTALDGHSPSSARLRDADERLRPMVAIVRSAPRADDPLVERLAALEAHGVGVAVVIGGAVPMVPNGAVRDAGIELPDGVHVRMPVLTDDEDRQVRALLREAGAELAVAAPAPPVRTVGATDAVAEIRLLGPIEVAVRGTTIDWRADGSVDLLAWMATHPGAGVGAAPELVFDEDLWSRMASELALRSGLDDDEHTRIVDKGRGLRGATTDVARFRDLLDSAERTGHAALLDEALDLVRGPALGTGASRPGWAEAIADRLTAEVVEVVRRSVDHHRRAGNPDGVRIALEAGVRADPGDESLWRDLIQVVAELHGREAAAEVVRRLRRSLGRTIGRHEALQEETAGMIRRLDVGARESA